MVALASLMIVFGLLANVVFLILFIVFICVKKKAWVTMLICCGAAFAMLVVGIIIMPVDNTQEESVSDKEDQLETHEEKEPVKEDNPVKQEDEEQEKQEEKEPEKGPEREPEKKKWDGKYRASDEEHNTLDWRGLVVKIVSCGEFTDYDAFFEPSDGMKIVYIEIEAKNTSSSDKNISSSDFSCFADGYSADKYIWEDDIIKSTDLSEGRRTSGRVYFEVPVDASEIEVEYEPNFLFGDKYIIVVEP